MVISSDGQFALSGSWDGTLRLWDLNTGNTTRRFVGHTKDVLSVAFSVDNRQVGVDSDRGWLGLLSSNGCSLVGHTKDVCVSECCLQRGQPPVLNFRLRSATSCYAVLVGPLSSTILALS